MRGLVKLGLLAGVAIFAYNSFSQSAQARSKDRAPSNTGHVRNAGPHEQKGIANDDWDTVDQQVDESFPASDPPGNY